MLKKFLTILILGLILIFSANYLYYYNGDYYIKKSTEITCISASKDQNLYLKENNHMKIFDLQGVDIGMGKPGHFAPENAISKKEYTRWFKQIQALGANTIRIYTIASPEFYEAFYDYNQNNSTPLYLIQGIDINEALLNSNYSALDKELYNPFLNSCKNAVDIIHGRHKLHHSENLKPIFYDKDISRWVYGYLLGPEWDVSLVEYTNSSLPQAKQLNEDYLYTEDANNFEIFLATIGNETIKYESEKYANQHAIAFSNGPFTDPFEYSEKIRVSLNKNAKIDVNHIHTRSNFKGALFASYNVYPYFPEFVHYEDNDKHIQNTYLEYLTRLVNHHKIPVVISEFGVPTSRARSSFESNRELARDQGRMNEQEQGKALISMCEDINKAGCAGKLLFNWQDEWFKTSWNTHQFINTSSLPYWHNMQDSAQSCGLLSFDPGKKGTVCYVDGKKSEWRKEDIVIDSPTYKLSIKYDLQSLYFLIESPNFNINKDKLYLAIDTTPHTGSDIVKNFNLNTSKKSDFILELNGKKNSRLWVHERYNVYDILYHDQLTSLKTSFTEIPKKDSTTFEKNIMVLHERNYYKKNINNESKKISFRKYNPNRPYYYYSTIKTHETGKLLYGNSNPKSKNFNSLADFCAGDGFVEIRLPWQLLNFADPSEMLILDDYYEKQGIEFFQIDHINVGAGDGKTTIEMAPFALEPLGKEPVYHERLKQSYYILQDYWTK